MNLGFSADHEAMRLEFRKLLARSRPRTAFEAPRDASGIGDAALWQQLAELGWLATAVPEAQGGSGLDPLVLCVLAEEAGCHLAAVPFTASACSFTQGLLAFAGDAPVKALLGRLADGSARGVLLTDECWPKPPSSNPLSDTSLALTGRARNVLDGSAATHALACLGQGAAARLVLVALAGVPRREAAGLALDLLHPCCDLAFDQQSVHVLARGTPARARWGQMVGAHALFLPFQQPARAP